MIRVVHATDIHWFVPPRLRQLASKRLIGSVNLYLRGRRHHFDDRVQDALVRSMLDAAADVVLISGDLTAQAIHREFELALAKLSPLLARPALVQAGNHDVYTRGSSTHDRIAQHFGPWLHRRPDGLARLDLPGLTILGLDPNRPHPLASGRVPEAQLAALPAALADTRPDDAVILSLHYPILDRHGRLYDGWTHGLENASALVEVLRRSARKPTLIVHGHQHHGYRVALDLGDVQVPIVDPGSGGYAYEPERDRAACFCVYTFEGPRLVEVERHRHTERGFAPEPGGAFATGR
jgi:3',5'-cyclic AMP phosphodiesterase CpdA